MTTIETTGSGLIAALEQTWADIRRRTPQLPEVVVVTGTGLSSTAVHIDDKTLLYISSGGRLVLLGGLAQHREDLTGDVALEFPQRVAQSPDAGGLAVAVLSGCNDRAACGVVGRFGLGGCAKGPGRVVAYGHLGARELRQR